MLQKDGEIDEDVSHQIKASRMDEVAPSFRRSL
uniref:Uncharacterized protein n=1 Tax=Arundo donax TaxID=35708 RepID=A0A0A9DZH8_ARUDO